MTRTDPEETSSLFDFDEAVESLGGNVGLFGEMVGFFFSDGLNLLTEIQAAAAAGDTKAIAGKAHRLKGTLLYLGCRAATEAVARVEILGRAADLTAATLAIPAMEAEVTRLAEAFAPLCSRRLNTVG